MFRLAALVVVFALVSPAQSGGLCHGRKQGVYSNPGRCDTYIQCSSNGFEVKDCANAHVREACRISEANCDYGLWKNDWGTGWARGWSAESDLEAVEEGEHGGHHGAHRGGHGGGHDGGHGGAYGPGGSAGPAGGNEFQGLGYSGGHGGYQSITYGGDHDWCSDYGYANGVFPHPTECGVYIQCTASNTEIVVCPSATIRTACDAGTSCGDYGWDVDGWANRGNANAGYVGYELGYGGHFYGGGYGGDGWGGDGGYGGDGWAGDGWGRDEGVQSNATQVTA